MPRIDALPTETRRALNDYVQAWMRSPEDLRCLDPRDPSASFNSWLARVMTVRRRPTRVTLAIYEAHRRAICPVPGPFRDLGADHAA